MMQDLFEAIAVLILAAFVLFVTVGFWVIGCAAFFMWLGGV